MPEFPHRPDHPDFWLLSQGCIDQDAQADAGQGFEDMIGRYVDPASLHYVATQRAIRIAANPAQLPLVAGTWLDGFLQGVRFQILKERQNAE